MSSYGAYYYNSGKPENKSDTGSSRRESPTPKSYADRPGTAGRFGARRRSITPPDAERRVPYYQEMERPRNPGSHDERAHTQHMDRPTTEQVPPTGEPVAVQQNHSNERQRADSPDPSEVSDISEPEIRPNYTTVDYYTYSKCLERVLSDPNLAMPVRMGVIGKWGAGKSKIIKGILWCLKQACDTSCSQLREPVDAPRNIRWIHRSCGCCDMSFFTYLFFLFVLLLVIIAAVLLAFLLGVAPYVIDQSQETIVKRSLNSTSASTTPSLMSQENVALTVTISLVAVLLLIICLAGIFKCLKDRHLRGVGDMLSHFRALAVMALCDTPPPPQATTDKVEMIPICFNPSEYADSDESWSAMAKLLLTQCEEMFGFWKSRLYRISSKDLQHEHDFLVADEDKWRYTGQDRTGAHAHRSIASALPSHPKSARKSASSKSRTAANRAYNSSNSTFRKSSLKTKANKVVATEDNFDKKLNIPVHTAKWKSIGYPWLITVGISAVVTATAILIVISLGIDIATEQVYNYVIIACAAAVMVVIILIFIKGMVLLLSSACSSPTKRIDSLREKHSKNKLTKTGGAGFMHQVKEEIVILVGFIRYMEHIYQRRFRILLTIDDLDKCSEERIFETLNAIKVLFGEPTFPIVTIIGMDAELISRSLSKMGVESGQTYINQHFNMKFCLPDSTQYDIVKLLESQAEHLLCATSVRVNRLKELSDHRYKTSDYKQSRREALHELDVQHDYEEKPKPPNQTPFHYYSHPVSGRHVSTAMSKRSKSSRSKKRVIFTPLKSASTSEEGLIDGPARVANPQNMIEKPVVPPLSRLEHTESTSPPEIRKSIEKKIERPDSQLASVKPPKSEMKREPSTLGDDSSDDEQIIEEPPWMLAMSSGEARKDNSKGTVSLRRTQLADSEKTDEQLAEQHIHAVAEMKVLLGVSQGLITALVNNPSYELTVSQDSGLGSIKNTPLHVNLQALSRDEIKRHILAYGLRKRMVYLALDEVRRNVKLLDNNFTRMSQLFNSVYLSIYIWVQKLKQLGVVDAVLDDNESDKVVIKLIKTCQELTKWVMLCELWPYRASWLIYKVERVNRKMGDFPSSSFYLEASIRDIYKDIRPDIQAAKEDFELWRSYDYSDTTFKKCLERFKDISGLSILRYLPFTANVDRVYKVTINQYMSSRGKHNHSLLLDQEGQMSTKAISFAEDNEETEAHEK